MRMRQLQSLLSLDKPVNTKFNFQPKLQKLDLSNLDFNGKQ